MRRTHLILATLLGILLYSLGFLTHFHWGENLERFSIRMSTWGYLPVASVADGDTLSVSPWWGKKRSVRLIGVDTPESVDPHRPVECFGPEASKYTKGLAEGRRVWLTFDSTQSFLDDHGRLVAYVYVSQGLFSSDVFLNRDLIEKGYAEEWTYRKKYTLQKEFRAAEKAAQATLQGRWGACGLNSKKHI